MQPRSMLDRLTLLEQRVSQIEATPVSALRSDMRAEFANLREEMRGEFVNVREEMRGEFANVREEMGVRFEAVDRRFEVLEQRMEQGFEETRRHARVLYEDLVTRIATIGEGSPAPTRRKP